MEQNSSQFQRVIQSPFFIIASIIISVFISGFGVKEYFENYKLTELKSQLSSKDKEIVSLRTKVTDIDSLIEAKETKRYEILRFLVNDMPDYLMRNVAYEYPEKYRDRIVSSGIRQLIESADDAAFLTPDGDRLMCKVSLTDNGGISTTFDRLKYNLIENHLIEIGASVSKDELSKLYVDVTINGAASHEFILDKQRTVTKVIMTPEVGIGIATSVYEVDK